jgi:hypothetical protein
MRECLDWFIKNRFNDIHIVYADNGDYLYDEDMDIIKMGNYELVNMKRLPDKVELCFEIIFNQTGIPDEKYYPFKGRPKSKNPYENETEAEIFIYEDEWIQINRDFQLNNLLN